MTRRYVTPLLCLLFCLTPTWACTSGNSQTPARAGGGHEIRIQGNSLIIDGVTLRATAAAELESIPGANGYTNGTDSFYTTPLTDGGSFVLHRYAPPAPTVTSNPYPEITLPGQTLRYAAVVPSNPFYSLQTVTPPFTFATPFSQVKWPAFLSDAGVGVVAVAESPIFEEAIEPFVSAYPTLRVLRNSTHDITLRFDDVGAQPNTTLLKWSPIETTPTTTTYVAALSDPTIKTIAIHLKQAASAKRVWYLAGNKWVGNLIAETSTADPSLLLVHVEKPQRILVETGNEPPASPATLYSKSTGYVTRARWSAFAIYRNKTSDSFFKLGLATSMKAYNDLLYALRDQTPVGAFSPSWTELLKMDAFTNGKNLLNPKFFNVGFPEAADPTFGASPELNISVSWVSDEAALQAAIGSRLFGFTIDPRYGEGVKAFYDQAASFYYGAYKRSTRQFTSSDTGGDGVVIGYNYLLSLSRLTELIGTQPGLSAADVQGLVDRAIPLLQAGYFNGYPQVPYLWKYPSMSGLQWEYGMGKELSEAQLSYVCGLWWIRTHESRYKDCQTTALLLPEQVALTVQGSSYLWGLDVVHGGYVMDALLLAYRTTGERHYLDAVLTGWREQLLFLFSSLKYPETPFDDRAIAFTSYYSTFADLHRGNYWRDDSWNNERTLWSLSKVLAFVDDPRVVIQLQAARETHKQSMPLIDAVYRPSQPSIDVNDLELSYEDLRNHYSTQIAFSTDVWREAFIFDSVGSSQASVYRIPGAVLSDPGLAYVVGKANDTVRLAIQSRDCTFANGLRSVQIRLNADGIARVPLFPAPT